MPSFEEFFKSIPNHAYTIPGFDGYFDGRYQNPERCFQHLKSYIPEYVTGVLNIGCANGRNFLPFENKYKLYGFDIVPESRIRWPRQFNNMVYRTLTVEDFTKLLEDSSVDCSKLLVITSGVLMYIPGDYQNRFFKALRDRGCKNFICQEFTKWTNKHDDKHFKLDKSLFMFKEYRKNKGPEQARAHILLDLSPEMKGALQAERVALPFTTVRYITASAHRWVWKRYWKVAGILVRIRRAVLR